VAWWAIFRKEEMRTLNIKPEFRDLIPPLQPHELEQLHKSLSEDGGARDPLTVWKGADILLDGHNRYDYCTKHNLAFKVDERELESEADAHDWIIKNQIGRRNLSKDASLLLIGKLYNSRKKPKHRPEKGDQNDPLNPEKTADIIAKETGVGSATVKRAAKFTDEADKLGLTSKIMAGDKDAAKQVKQSLKEQKRPDAPPAYSAPEGDDNEQEGGFPDLTPSADEQEKANMKIAKEALKIIKTIKPNSFGSYEAFGFLVSEIHKHQNSKK